MSNAVEDAETAASSRRFLLDTADDAILLVPETSKLTGLTPATLRWYRHAGRGPKSFKLGGRRVAYLARDVREWLEAQYAATDS